MGANPECTCHISPRQTMFSSHVSGLLACPCWHTCMCWDSVALSCCGFMPVRSAQLSATCKQYSTHALASWYQQTAAARRTSASSKACVCLSQRQPCCMCCMCVCRRGGGVSQELQRAHACHWGRRLHKAQRGEVRTNCGRQQQVFSVHVFHDATRLEGVGGLVSMYGVDGAVHRKRSCQSIHDIDGC